MDCGATARAPLPSPWSALTDQSIYFARRTAPTREVRPAPARGATNRTWSISRSPTSRRTCASWRTTSPRRRSAPSPGSTTRRAPGRRRSSQKAWEVGLMNTHIPEEYGGPGAGYLDGCLIEEELSWGCSGIQTSLGCNGLATAPIVLGGSEEIKKKYLGAVTEELKLVVVLPDRARRRLATCRGCARAPSRRATSTCSTARSASSPTAATPTTTPSTRRPTRTPATAASPRSSSSASGASSSTRRRTSSASAPPTPRRSPSTTSRSRPRTCSARRTTASSSR